MLPDGLRQTGAVPSDGVIIYGTPWCGACQRARAFLEERNVPYRFKDIEKDATFAAELADKAAWLRVRADRVPVLDIRGVLVIGFEPARIRTLIGDPS